MPYGSPEDRIEGEHPEVVVPETLPENQLSVEDKVRCCFPHVLVRFQPPEAEETVHKMQQIFFDRRDNKITKEECAQKIADLRANEIAQWITDPVAHNFVEIACSAILDM